MKTEIKVYTAAEITEAADTWVNYNGFVGEECGKCKKTANVLDGGAGYICECGNFTIQSWDGEEPYETPDYGPTLETIREGHKNSKRMQKLFGDMGSPS